MLVASVLAQPESMPALDWAFYASRVSAPGMVDQFQKQMAAVKVPYPEDKVSGQIDTQAKEAVSGQRGVRNVRQRGAGRWLEMCSG